MEVGVLAQLDGARQTVRLFVSEYRVVRKVRSCYSVYKKLGFSDGNNNLCCCNFVYL